MDFNWNRCIKFVLQFEGSKFTDDPVDPGGATKFGITFNTLKAWRKTSITKDDVRNLTLNEAMEIYKDKYWDAINCHITPEPMDLLIFDFGVNAGQSRSIKFAQRVLGVSADGVLGPKTLAALEGYDPEKFIPEFHTKKMAHYRSLSIWWKYKNGWTRRANDAKILAKALLIMPDVSLVPTEAEVPNDPIVITPRISIAA